MLCNSKVIKKLSEEISVSKEILSHFESIQGRVQQKIAKVQGNA